MEKALNLLNYWYNLEFFTPFWPEINKDTIYIKTSDNNLPWLINTSPELKYDIYLGKLKIQNLVVKLVESIGDKTDDIELDNSQTCLCALKLDFEGVYIENSFSISTFVWAVSKIIIYKNLRIDVNKKEVNDFNSEMNDIITSMNRKIKYKELNEIYLLVLKKLSLNLDDNSFFTVVNKNFNKNEDQKNEKMLNNQFIQEDKDVEINTEMFKSFYIYDIEMIKRNMKNTDKIVHYIEALKTPIYNRIEIDVDVSYMKKHLSPDKYPLGKWPSVHSPSLMQQIAINISISEGEIPSSFFSVNGPPGTGKTTLLKEVVASHLVNRALLLCEYDKPDDVFEKKQFSNPVNEFLKYYYQPDDELIKYGILVASNNNSAVENISKELPRAEDVQESNTTLFDIDINNEIYFSVVANELMGNDLKCWGLISARLGKKSNINELINSLWFNKEASNLQSFYKGELPNWDQAKVNFKKKYYEVLEYRKKIEEAVLNSNKHSKIAEEYVLAENKLREAEKEKVSQELIYENFKNKEILLNNHIKDLEKNSEILYSRLSIFKRLFICFFKNNPIVIQINKIKQELDLNVIKYTNLNMNLSDTKIRLEEVKTAFDYAQNNFEEKRNDLLKSKNNIIRYKEQFGNNFAGDDFWIAIDKNEISQLASPWTNKEYDSLREELFYYGLQLQKAFVLNSKCVKNNLNCLVNIWNNKILEQDKALSYSHLLNTLFFVIPVVSTTFASVSSFLNHIGKNELGTLIIDEAGQATPQSALGALWRTRKAIIVGDPLQIEPIVNVPKELCKRFAEEFSIDDEYKSQDLSVQVLADSMNSYGGYRSIYNHNKLWLGCPLVVHRRCSDPMFSIANEIAYNNRMFKQSKEANSYVKLLFEKSIWIDLKGKEIGNKNHFVLIQGEKVVELVLQALVLQKEFPNIYIISPFKTVINNLKPLLREAIYNYCRDYVEKYNKDDINNWLNKSCGTIHTFQGKEANEVILILGCDLKSGRNAAYWAGKKPNILNVALTRAKYRIVVIGDSDLWRTVPYFDLAYKYLSKD